MSAVSSFNAPTLYETLAPAGRLPGRLLPSIIVVVLGSLLLTISAKFQIPMQPVPLTLQTLVVLGLGVVFGPSLGLATVLAYLAQGAMGFAVFAGTPEKGVGLAYMMGPTGGYLLGFAAAAYVSGWLARAKWDRHILSMLLAMVVGNLIIYALGVSHLAGFIGLEKAIQFGVSPFLLGDVIKIVAAALIVPSLWKAIGRKPSEASE